MRSLTFSRTVSKTVFAGMTLAVLLGGGPATAEARQRRIVRCCVDVPAPEEGTTRPWCFNIRARSRWAGRRVCRMIGGGPPGRVRAR
jgi:hypothetical protein